MEAADARLIEDTRERVAERGNRAAFHLGVAGGSLPEVVEEENVVRRRQLRKKREPALRRHRESVQKANRLAPARAMQLPVIPVPAGNVPTFAERRSSDAHRATGERASRATPSRNLSVLSRNSSPLPTPP